MALLDMRISKVVFNDATNELTFHLAGGLAPSLPPGVREDLAIMQESGIVVGPVRLNKGAVTLAACIWVDPDTGLRYKQTWNGSAWSAPVQIDSNDQPMTGK